uniref:dehydrogenase/reductase SDR family member 1 n=1 Tax=Myxine glutinosa TaxID=7769 RepID=UPI00358FB104
MAQLAGKVCVVTGASRGIGKGIALQLCGAGATVYITGRNSETLREAANEIENRGGRCLPVRCDSTNDLEIQSLFDQVKKEQNGRLDILVNNAYAGVDLLFSTMGKPFWELPVSAWDTINNTGLRSHYACTVLASRLMVENKQGLIITISSFGGLRYLFSVPYGVGKAACDRMAADTAIELRRHGVASVSLWPGAVQTEIVREQIIEAPAEKVNQKMRKLFLEGETTELSGKCIVSLANDPKLMKKSGKVLWTCDLASEYKLSDIEGKRIARFNSLKGAVLQFPGFEWLAPFIPGFVTIPKWVLTLSGSKF